MYIHICTDTSADLMTAEKAITAINPFIHVHAYGHMHNTYAFIYVYMHTYIFTCIYIYAQIHL
jgi:hypothetical protein